jgi:DNA-binding transcriptional MerR regulator
MSGYSIKQVSKSTGLPAPTLRYYEKEGLLPNISRSSGGNRRFSEEDMEALELICCLKSTGMPIKKIKEFVELSGLGKETLNTRCEMLYEHKRSVEEQIVQMQMHLKKVNCKIECFTAQYDAYQKNKGSRQISENAAHRSAAEI